MFCYLVGMTVDEERAYVLSRYDKKQGVIKSDCNLILCDFSIAYKTQNSSRNQRQEIFNLKNEECRQNFVNDLNLTRN